MQLQTTANRPRLQVVTNDLPQRVQSPVPVNTDVANDWLYAMCSDDGRRKLLAQHGLALAA